jgi:FkbM family methyltransferase
MMDYIDCDPSKIAQKTRFGIMHFWDAHRDHVRHVVQNNLIFDRHNIEALAPYIAPGTTVIDVGASWGQMSLIFSMLVGETGHVETIESSDFFAKLNGYNIAANDFAKNVRLHHNACWETSGVELDMFVPELDDPYLSFYSGMSVKGPSDDRQMPSHKVQTLAIDDIEFRSPVSAIKIDIQGADLYALYGARKTIEQYQPVVLFEYEQVSDTAFNTNFDKYMQFVEDIGYEVHRAITSGDFLCTPKGMKHPVVESGYLDARLNLDAQAPRNYVL